MGRDRAEIRASYHGAAYVRGGDGGQRGKPVGRRGRRASLLITTSGCCGGGVINESGSAALEDPVDSREDKIFQRCFGGGMVLWLWGGPMDECGRRAGAHRMQGGHGALCGGSSNNSGEKWQRVHSLVNYSGFLLNFVGRKR